MADLPAHQRTTEVTEFLEKLKPLAAQHAATGRCRLIFAMDATASGQPTWDRAARIQGEMFGATAGLGAALDVQLVFFRGINECRASRWMSSTTTLQHMMRQVMCMSGETQIEQVLLHTIRETQQQRVGALVYVGDAMEEPFGRLSTLAGDLGMLGTPAFMFHERGMDHEAGAAFQRIADLSHGAYVPFDSRSADRLKALLGAVAVYAVGGLEALTAYSKGKNGDVLRLTSRLRGG